MVPWNRRLGVEASSPVGGIFSLSPSVSEAMLFLWGGEGEDGDGGIGYVGPGDRKREGNSAFEGVGGSVVSQIAMSSPPSGWRMAALGV